MTPTATLEKLLDEFAALKAERLAQGLSSESAARLSILQDVLLEAGMVLASRRSPFPVRSPRVAMAVQVTYRFRDVAARAVTRDVGTRGVCIETDRPLERGTVVLLSMSVPGWERPLETAGEVVWSRADAMGIQLRVLAPEDAVRLRELVASRFDLEGHLRGLLRDAASERPLVRTGATVAMALDDRVLREASAALLLLHDLFVVDAIPDFAQPAVLVTDRLHAAEMRARYPSCELVLLDATAHDALSGPLAALRISAFVRRPANASGVLAAVQGVLNERPVKAWA